MSPQESNKMKKQLFFTFVPLAGIIYATAIGYSLATDHMFAVGLLLCATVGVSVMAVWVYKSN